MLHSRHQVFVLWLHPAPHIVPGGSKFGLFRLLFSSAFFFIISLLLLYVGLAFSLYRQNHISSKLILAYIILGYAIVPFYHFCTPIIFSLMGIQVVNDSDRESCRIEKWHTQILQYMSICVEHIPSGFVYGSGNSISFFVWNCQSYSFDNLIMRFSV